MLVIIMSVWLSVSLSVSLSLYEIIRALTSLPHCLCDLLHQKQHFTRPKIAPGPNVIYIYIYDVCIYSTYVQ